MSNFRKVLTYRVNDTTPDDHVGRRGEITYRDGFLYYHDGETPGGEIIGGGGSGGGGSTSWASVTGKPNFAAVATSGSYADLTNKPSIPTNVSDLTNDSGFISSVAWADVTGKPVFFSGAYADLTGKPSLFSGAYADLTGKPSIPDLTGYATEAWVNSQGFGSGSGGTGAQGPAGADGADGQDGASAYEVAVANGFVGNESAWLASLVGTNGNDGAQGPQGEPGADGAQGPAGADGAPGQGVPTGGTAGQVLAKVDSTDYNTEWVNQTGGATNEITNTDGFNTYSVSVGTDGVVTMNTARGSIEFGAMPEVGGPTHLHIMRPAGAEGATDLYFGDDYNYVKMPSSSYSQQGVEIGSSLNQGTVSVWRFGTDGDLVLPAGKTIRNISGTDLLAGDDTGGDPAYKGFKAHYGRMWGNNDDPNGPINKIVIYKDTVTPSSTIDASTNNDTFTVTGLTGSDVVAMLVVVGDEVNQTTTAELKTFAESVIDNVILDGGVEGQINSAADMKTAFYNNFATFSATLTDLKTNFEFFSVNNQFNISPTFATGDGANFSGISYNMDNDTLDLGSWGQGAPNTHEVNDVHVIPGNTIQDANGNFLLTPDNDITITITGVADGWIQTYTVTGTLPRPAEVWPSNSINDGGDDEYDTGNYITTNLESNISYNNGDVVSGSSAFGGGDYVVTYQNSIFGIFAVNPAIDSIATQGGSGMDGYGQADTGSLYGAADSGVNIGNFVFTNSTLTATDDDLYIKAVDDLWLDALQDDIHIRANDDVRIKVGYDFDEDSAQQEWRFDTSGYINFPDGSQQTTAWSGNVDYNNINNTPSIPSSLTDLISSGGNNNLQFLRYNSTAGQIEFSSNFRVVPFASIDYPDGVYGDKIGDVAFDADAIYYCATEPNYIGDVTITSSSGYANQAWITITSIPASGPVQVGQRLTDGTNTTTVEEIVEGWPGFTGSRMIIRIAAVTSTWYDGTPSTLSIVSSGNGISTGNWVKFSKSYNDLTDKPTLFSGDYDDLTNKPTIPADVSNLTDTTSLLFSGSYDDLTDKPTLFTANQSLDTTSTVTFDTVNATNITVNGQPTTYGVASPEYINMTTSAAVNVATSGTDLTWDVNNGSSGIAYSAGKFSLTAGKTYHILAEIAMQNFSANGYLLVELVDGTTNAQIGSQTVTLPYNSGFNEVNNPTLDIVHTPVANQDVKLRVTGGTGGLTAQLRGGGFARMSIVQINPTIAVQATATGTVSKNYAKYTRTASQSVSVNSVIICNVAESSSGTAVSVNTSTGQATLTAGTYRLRGTIGTMVSSNADSRVGYGWYNETTSSWIGEGAGWSSPGASNYNTTTSGTAEAVITVASTAVVSLRVTGATNIGSIGGNQSDFGGTYANPWIDIEQMGSTFALNALDTMTTTGNVTVGGNLNVTGGVRKSNRILTTTATLTLADAGGFIQFNGGPYTVTLPDPTLAANAGIGYRFWQNTASNITLSTPAGAFFGPSGTTTSTVVLVQTTTSYWDVWSDGFNWAVFGIKIA